jgi:hypothetical protein
VSDCSPDGMFSVEIRAPDAMFSVGLRIEELKFFQGVVAASPDGRERPRDDWDDTEATAALAV